MKNWTISSSIFGTLEGKVYLGSKTFGERAAWDFVEKEKPNFVLTAVNRSFVFGPQLFDEEVSSELNPSNQIVNSYIRSKLGADFEKRHGAFVDVRDVAKAHVVAFEKEEAKEKRLVVSYAPFTEQTILDILNDNVPELKEKIEVGTPGSDLGFFSTMSGLDNSKSNAILGLDYISLKDCLVDTTKQLIFYQAKH